MGPLGLEAVPQQPQMPPPGIRAPPGPAGQLVLLGPGEELTVTDATPGTRFLLMTGQPDGALPMFNGPYVD